MKNLLIFLAFSLSALPVFAAESQPEELPLLTEDSLTIVRTGNEYVSARKIMRKREFRDFLSVHDKEAYDYFNSAYRLSNTGWGLFGGGLTVNSFAVLFMLGSLAPLGVCLYTVGTATFVSGIVCLAIGYERMHSAHTFYSLRNGKRKSFNLSISPSSSGLGVALCF